MLIFLKYVLILRNEEKNLSQSPTLTAIVHRICNNLFIVNNDKWKFCSTKNFVAVDKMNSFVASRATLYNRCSARKSS